MNQKDFRILNTIGKQITNHEYNENQLITLLKIIENYFIGDDGIVYTAYLQNKELIENFRFKDNQPLEVNEEFQFLRLLAKVCMVYFKSNQKQYDYYVLQEINDTLNFIGTELFTKDVYHQINVEFDLGQPSYHYQLELYKYTFSMLEKMKSLIITMFDGRKEENDFTNYDLIDKRLQDALSKIAKDNKSLMRLNTLFFNTLKRTTTFNYLRKLRNKIVHDYLNPNKKKNYNLDIYILFILCFYSFTVVVDNLKTDDELVDVYQQVNKI